MSKRKTGLIFILASLPVFFYFFSVWEGEGITKPIVAISKKEKREPPANPYLSQLAHAYDSAFRTLMEKYNAPGASVAIVYDTTVVLLQGYGVRELNTRDSVDVHTVFRLASVSKPFASFLTGILVQEKVLKWDDLVASHWPSFKLKSQQSTHEVKIRHVLSHTTGLPYHTYTNLIEEELPFDTLLNCLRDVAVVSKPGELYSYQNVGYSIIGKVIEQATGKNYQKQLQEKVFAPLGMQDASTDYIGLLSNKNMAQPHLFKRGMLRPTIVHDTYYNVSPAGGVNASIADMANWLGALLGNRPDVIKKETLDSLFTPNVLANSRNRNFYKWNRVQQAYYGLGWRVLRFPNDTLVYHGGYVAGYRSEVALLPAEKIAICVLSNAPGQLIDNSLPVFLEIFDRYRETVKNWRPKKN
jgi:beta-lactamase class C